LNQNAAHRHRRHVRKCWSTIDKQKEQTVKKKRES